METEYCVKEFELEFEMAKTTIETLTAWERQERWAQGRHLQHCRWRDMGHTFVFSGLAHLIQTGKHGS